MGKCCPPSDTFIASQRGGFDSVTDFSIFQILLIPRLFPVWDFLAGMFVLKSMLNMSWGSNEIT